MDEEYPLLNTNSAIGMRLFFNLSFINIHMNVQEYRKNRPISQFSSSSLKKALYHSSQLGKVLEKFHRMVRLRREYKIHSSHALVPYKVCILVDNGPLGPNK